MPRKTTKKATRKAAPRKRVARKVVPEETPKETVEEVVEENRVAALPTWRGAQVVKILKEGHTTTALHCKLNDGTTAHVDRSLFE